MPARQFFSLESFRILACGLAFCAVSGASPLLAQAPTASTPAAKQSPPENAGKTKSGKQSPEGKQSPSKKQSLSNKEKAKLQPLFDGKTLKGWSTTNKHMFEKHGKVEVRKGELHLGMGQPASGVTWTKAFPKNNYEISLEAKRTDGGDFFCGLTFPVEKEFCSLIVGGWGGGVVGLSNVDANSAVENETTGYHEFKTNQWYKIRLRVSDQRIEAWIDKEQVVDLERKGHKFEIWWEQEPLRPMGIATWNTAAALRNIQVRSLPLAKKPAEKKPADKKPADQNPANKKPAPTKKPAQ